MADPFFGYRGNAARRRPAFQEPVVAGAPSGSLTPAEGVGDPTTTSWVCAECGGPVVRLRNGSAAPHGAWTVGISGPTEGADRCPGTGSPAMPGES